MAKSSFTLALAALLAAGPALAAEPPTAEEALARQKASLARSLGLEDCRRRDASDDIVICGRRERDPNRLPLDPEAEPGGRLAGEPVRPQDALAATAPPLCSTVGPNQRCGGGLPVIPIAIWLVQTVIEAAKGDD